MTHPVELLAHYVDGSLDGPERLRSSSAIWTPARSAATRLPSPRAARAALASVPEVEGPERPRRRRARGETTCRGTATGSPLAGRRARCPWSGRRRAAAALLVVAIALPRIGGGTAADDSAGVAGGSRGPRRPRPPSRSSHTDFDADSLRAGPDLGGALCRRRRRSGQAPPVPVPGSRRPERRRSGARSLFRARLACDTASAGSRGDPVRLVQARSRASRPTWRSCWKAPEPISRPTR